MPFPRRMGSINFVFVDKHGLPYPKNRVSVAFACKAAGTKDLGFHDLKHDFGTLLAANNVRSFRRQYLLDHSDPRTSQKYCHWSPLMLDAIDVIEGKGIGTILSQTGNKQGKQKRGYKL